MSTTSKPYSYKLHAYTFGAKTKAKYLPERNLPSRSRGEHPTYTANYSISRAVVRELRVRFPAAVMVAGGPHASALPEEVAEDFDFVVVGEGENEFVRLLRLIERNSTEPPPRILRAAPIEDLDRLPFPDFRRFCDLDTYTRRIGTRPVICVDSSRGCDHRCRFCNSRVVERGRWRARSAESVASELRWHVDQGSRAFRFNDDNFLALCDRASEICEYIQSLGTDLVFRIFARAESLCDRKLCDKLVAAGCRHVGVGIESLSKKMLKMMGKAATIEQMLCGVKTAHQAGMQIRGFFIVGFPGETEGTIAETLAQLEHLPLDEAVAYPCVPYPGTDLFARPADYGITWMDPDFSQYIQVGRDRSAGFVLRTGSFGPDEVRAWRQRYMDAFTILGMAWSDERGDVR